MRRDVCDLIIVVVSCENSEGFLYQFDFIVPMFGCDGSCPRSFVTVGSAAGRGWEQCGFTIRRGPRRKAYKALRLPSPADASGVSYETDISQKVRRRSPHPQLSLYTLLHALPKLTISKVSSNHNFIGNQYRM